MRNKFFTVIFCGFGLLCLTGCFTSADELCGVDRVYESEFAKMKFTERLDPLNATRIFSYEDLDSPEDICADEHSKAVFELELWDHHSPNDIEVKGIVYWGLNFSKEVKLTLNAGVKSGVISDIGLKQFFKDKPGWIGLQIIFEFPTQGSLEKDVEYYKDRVKGFDIRYFYNEHI